MHQAWACTKKIKLLPCDIKRRWLRGQGQGSKKRQKYDIRSIERELYYASREIGACRRRRRERSRSRVKRERERERERVGAYLFALFAARASLTWLTGWSGRADVALVTLNACVSAEHQQQCLTMSTCYVYFCFNIFSRLYFLYLLFYTYFRNFESNRAYESC